MKIEYLHASKFGNGELVAAEFTSQMGAKGVQVDVHHINDMDPRHLPDADLYLFSSPGRIGKPKGNMRRFLKKLDLPAGTKYALLITEAMAKPDKKTGVVPTDEEMARWRQVIPLMNETLQGDGLLEVAEGTVHVVDIKGPLEDGWEKKVEEFVARIPVG
ncbi:flavodoxin family protein [Nocardioides pacificus]